MKKILIFTIMLLLFYSCSKGPGKKEVSTGADIKPVTVEVKTVEYEKFAEYIEFSARPEGITDIVLSSEVNGRIEQVEKSIGDDIRKGEEIGRIDNEDYLIRLKQSKASLLAAEAALEAADVELKAAEKLYKTKKISDTEILRTRYSYKNSLAGLESAKAAVEQNRKYYNSTMFLSPVNGKITELNIKKGENITSGRPVCTIVDASELKIITGIGESDISKLSESMPVTVMREGLSEPITGKITGIGMKPSAGTVNYPVEIILPNPGETIYPGMTVKCHIETGADENAIVITTDNIVSEYDMDYVYLVSAGTAVKRKIVSGRKYGNRLSVVSGLKPGDKLIVSGIENIIEGTIVRER